jgi:hypothetical protein
MTTLITASTIKAALRDQRQGKRYDVSDSRVSGLQLRVKPQSVRWSLRARLHGNQRRYDLGRAVEGDEDIEGLSLLTARARAMRIYEMVRKRQNPNTFLAALAAGVSIETQLKNEASRPKPSWTWEKAKTEFLAEVKRSRREDTHRDYRGKLLPAELARFEGRQVNTVTRNEMAAAIADVHARDAEAMAEGMVRVIKRFWSWLAEAVRQDETNVADGVMLKLVAPPRTRVEIGEEAFDPEDEKGDAPPEIAIGRALVMARQRYFPERICLGIELLIGTCQRRRTVTGANRWRFRTYPEANDECAWYVPPYFRKSGTKRGRRSHLVPCVAFAAHAADRLDRLADFEGSEGWLFPARSDAKDNRPHAEASLFNDYLQAMPGIDFSPHAVRYAFATYGERDLAFRPGEAKIILDHMEGVEPTDVTGSFYSSDPQIARKRAMMRAWTDWCDGWAQRAIAEDPLLLDRAYMLEAIYRARYGEKRLESRIESRRKRGLPLWNVLDIDDLAEAAE